MMHPSDAAGQTDYRQLAVRMGRETLKRRMLKQAGLWAGKVHQGRGFFRVETLPLPISIDDIVRHTLRCFGLAGVARRNYLAVRLVHNEVAWPGLPAAFDGFRILQLADLHCDLEPELIDVILRRLKGAGMPGGLPCDMTALTGDYHNKIACAHDHSLELMGRLVPMLKPPRLAVLGNHDFIEKVAYLEAAGLRVLLNESFAIERGGSRLWICGVDDPHFFQTDDLAKARSRIPPDEPSILLSHSPENYREAERLGFGFMLCGHTHGGQLCLPGGFAIVKNASVPRRLLAGSWREGALAGYTSRGTGGCGVAARFFCPPEITIHTLRTE